ncbi:hypothetical protein SDC9_136257 [bioreactor metagenome]|uniref:Uncharacterized protein n=1 Tax=bioreactor metagenome TaxID=1076179 RepID=A0A645DIM9_9ZZZZ
MLLYKVTFMFRLQVRSPVYGKFELLPRFFEYLYPFSIGQAHKIVFHHEIQTVYQFFIVHLGQKLDILPTMLQCIADKIF